MKLKGGPINCSYNIGDRSKSLSATAARQFEKILVFGPSLIGLVQNVSITRHLTTPTGCPVGSIVLLTQHSDGTACTKSSDATAARLTPFLRSGAVVLEILVVGGGHREASAHVIPLVVPRWNLFHYTGCVSVLCFWCIHSSSYACRPPSNLLLLLTPLFTQDDVSRHLSQEVGLAFARTTRRAVDKILMRHVRIGEDTANHPPKLSAVPVPWLVHILESEQALALAIVVVDAMLSQLV